MADELRKRIRLIHISCAAGVLAILAGAGVFGVLPLLKSGRDNIQSAQHFTDELNQLESVRIKAEEYQKKIAAISLLIDREEKRLPSGAQMDQFLNELSTVAKTAGVKIEGFDKGDLLKSGNFKVLPAQVLATGTYAQCYSFLSGLRQMERLTRLENASIITEAKSGEAAKPGERGDCQLRVAIATYMAK